MSYLWAPAGFSPPEVPRAGHGCAQSPLSVSHHSQQEQIFLEGLYFLVLLLLQLEHKRQEQKASGLRSTSSLQLNPSPWEGVNFDLTGMKFMRHGCFISSQSHFNSIFTLCTSKVGAEHQAEAVSGLKHRVSVCLGFSSL